MIDSVYLKVALIILGVLVILSNLVDFQNLLSKLIFKSKVKVDSNKQNDFLEIIELWYQLKNKCDQSNLHIASEKLDEVFPLLNGMLEDEKNS